MLKVLVVASLFGSSAAFAGTPILKCTNDDATVKVGVFQNSNGALVARVGTESVGGSFPTFTFRVSDASPNRAARVLAAYMGTHITIVVYNQKTKQGYRGKVVVPQIGVASPLDCTIRGILQ